MRASTAKKLQPFSGLPARESPAAIRPPASAVEVVEQAEVTTEVVAPAPEVLEWPRLDAEPGAEREGEPGDRRDECPACGHREARVLFKTHDRLYGAVERTFDLVECAGCRMLRLAPWPTASELRSCYPDRYWRGAYVEASSRLGEFFRQFILRGHVNFTVEALRRADIEGPVLEVGCGNGLLLRLLAEKGLPVAGLEFALPAASAAWLTHHVPVACASLAHAPFPPGSFAAVTMLDVVDRLFDPVAYLEGARSLLKPGGRLIVQAPNAACWQFLLFAENWSGLDSPRRLIHYRLDDLEILLDRCGFEVERVKHFSLRDNPAGLATSLAPSLDPAARRVRGVVESARLRLMNDLLYLGLAAAALPFTLLEAACRAGSTVLVEARRKD